MIAVIEFGLNRELCLLLRRQTFTHEFANLMLLHCSFCWRRTKVIVM